MDLADDVYQALRVIARRALARSPAQLDPTDLVHQAWVDLSARWADLPRSQFLALCARVMRRISVDEARRIGVRGGVGRRVTLSGVAVSDTLEAAVDVLDLDQALQELRAHDSRWAEIVELRYFGGLTGDEVSEVLGLSRKTVVRDWAFARAWLQARLVPGV